MGVAGFEEYLETKTIAEPEHEVAMQPASPTRVSDRQVEHERFEDKVVVVTGAAQGIGEAYARALARRGRRRSWSPTSTTRPGEQVAKEIEADGGGRSSCAPTSRPPSRRRRWSRRPSRRTAGSTGWSTTPRSTATWQFDLLITRRLGLLQEVHVGEHGRRAGDDPRGLPARSRSAAAARSSTRARPRRTSTPASTGSPRSASTG